MWLSTVKLAILGSQLFVAVADDMPRLDPTATCRAATRVSSATFEGCMADETKARTDLVAQWSRFPAADRRSCVPADRALLSQSYVDLLTCLQMAGAMRGTPRQNQ